MNLLSFISPNQQRSYGIATDKGIIDLGKYIGNHYPTLKDLLNAQAVSEAKQYNSKPIDYQLNQVTLLPVIENPHKILCVGMNYEEKRKEFGETDTAPTLFIRFPDSQTAHNGNLIKPHLTKQFDYEGELAVIIGKGGRYIPEADVYQHIAGYSCYMDGSLRDWQHTWYTAGKNWPSTGGFGPWLTTADQIPNPHHLEISTYLNGERVQHDITDHMVHKIPELVAYISSFTELSPGDVILTGSPGGVGKSHTPPLFLKQGDIIEVEIERIGKLRNTVIDETAQ